MYVHACRHALRSSHKTNMPAATTAAAAAAGPTSTAVALLEGGAGGASSGVGSVMVVPMGDPTGAASSSSVASSATGPAPSKEPTGVCATGVMTPLGLASPDSSAAEAEADMAATATTTSRRVRDNSMVLISAKRRGWLSEEYNGQIDELKRYRCRFVSVYFKLGCMHMHEGDEDGWWRVDVTVNGGCGWWR